MCGGARSGSRSPLVDHALLRRPVMVEEVQAMVGVEAAGALQVEIVVSPHQREHQARRSRALLRRRERPLPRRRVAAQVAQKLDVARGVAAELGAPHEQHVARLEGQLHRAVLDKVTLLRQPAKVAALRVARRRRALAAREEDGGAASASASAAWHSRGHPRPLRATSIGAARSRRRRRRRRHRRPARRRRHRRRRRRRGARSPRRRRVAAPGGGAVSAASAARGSPAAAAAGARPHPYLLMYDARRGRAAAAATAA